MLSMTMVCRLELGCHRSKRALGSVFSSTTSTRKLKIFSVHLFQKGLSSHLGMIGINMIIIMTIIFYYYHGYYYAGVAAVVIYVFITMNLTVREKLGLTL